jgi:hypothetical protein
VAVEVNYEERALELEPKKTKHLLPIKTKGGLVYRSIAEDFNGKEIIPCGISYCRNEAKLLYILSS